MVVFSESWPFKFVDLSVIERHSSYPVEELNKFSILIITLLHASLQPQGNKRKLHLTLWFAALIGGIGADMIFSYLPLVDNFFHGQATLMLYPRLPAYIVFFYLGWFYIPMAIAWQLGLPPVAESVLSAFLSFFYYIPWDIVGLKHLWWTWHDSDSSFQHRLVNVPIVSTMFVIVQSFCVARLIRGGIGCSSREQYDKQHSPLLPFKVFLSVMFTVPGLMTIMTTLQVVFGMTYPPAPSDTSTLAKTLITFVLLGIFGLRSPGQPKAVPSTSRYNWLLYFGVALHLGWMLACTLLVDSTTQVSIGVHQSYGDCDLEAHDLFGQRRVNICEEKSTQDFRFRCGSDTSLPEPNSLWYTICGTEKSDEWITKASTVIGTSGMVFFITFLVSHVLHRRKSKDKSD